MLMRDRAIRTQGSFYSANKSINKPREIQRIAKRKPEVSLQLVENNKTLNSRHMLSTPSTFSPEIIPESKSVINFLLPNH